MSRSSASSSRSAARLSGSLAALFFTGESRACPCAPGAAPVTALSVAGDDFALRASVAAITDTAAWDERGRAYPTPSGVSTRRLVFEAAGAWRPTRAVELSLLAGAALSAADEPGVSVRAASLGDVTARARWEIRNDWRWRVAAAGSVRVPTGDRVAGTVANGVAGLGLGAWEFALGGELARRSDSRGEVGIAAEVGVRAPTPRAAGPTWTPGPRATITLFGAWRATGALTATASVSQSVELDAWRDGERVADSGTRRLSVALGVGLRVDRAVWSVGLAADPWINGLGANATATLRATLAVTFGR